MWKLYSQRYTELSNDPEYDFPDSVPEDEDDPFFDSSTDDGHSSPPPYASLWWHKYSKLHFCWWQSNKQHTCPNAGPHTTAAGQPTGMQYVMQVVN